MNTFNIQSLLDRQFNSRCYENCSIRFCIFLMAAILQKKSTKDVTINPASNVMSWYLTYPLPRPFWRWVSFAQDGDMLVSWRERKNSTLDWCRIRQTKVIYSIFYLWFIRARYVNVLFWVACNITFRGLNDGNSPVFMMNPPVLMMFKGDNIVANRSKPCSLFFF